MKGKCYGNGVPWAVLGLFTAQALLAMLHRLPSPWARWGWQLSPYPLATGATALAGKRQIALR
ncbi:hypothetical protein SAVIM40S_07754 [Streptomyces avidinii]